MRNSAYYQTLVLLFFYIIPSIKFQQSNVQTFKLITNEIQNPKYNMEYQVTRGILPENFKNMDNLKFLIELKIVNEDHYYSNFKANIFDVINQKIKIELKFVPKRNDFKINGELYKLNHLNRRIELTHTEYFFTFYFEIKKKEITIYYLENISSPENFEFSLKSILSVTGNFEQIDSENLFSLYLFYKKDIFEPNKMIFNYWRNFIILRDSILVQNTKFLFSGFASLKQAIYFYVEPSNSKILINRSDIHSPPLIIGSWDSFGNSLTSFFSKRTSTTIWMLLDNDYKFSTLETPRLNDKISVGTSLLFSMNFIFISLSSYFENEKNLKIFSINDQLNWNIISVFGLYSKVNTRSDSSQYITYSFYFLDYDKNIQNIFGIEIEFLNHEKIEDLQFVFQILILSEFNNFFSVIFYIKFQDIEKYSDILKVFKPSVNSLMVSLLIGNNDKSTISDKDLQVFLKINDVQVFDGGFFLKENNSFLSLSSYKNHLSYCHKNSHPIRIFHNKKIDQFYLKESSNSLFECEKYKFNYKCNVSLCEVCLLDECLIKSHLQYYEKFKNEFSFDVFSHESFEDLFYYNLIEKTQNQFEYKKTDKSLEITTPNIFNYLILYPKSKSISNSYEITINNIYLAKSKMLFNISDEFFKSEFFTEKSIFEKNYFVSKVENNKTILRIQNNLSDDFNVKLIKIENLCSKNYQKELFNNSIRIVLCQNLKNSDFSTQSYFVKSSLDKDISNTFLKSYYNHNFRFLCKNNCDCSFFSKESIKNSISSCHSCSSGYFKNEIYLREKEKFSECVKCSNKFCLNCENNLCIECDLSKSFEKTNFQLIQFPSKDFKICIGCHISCKNGCEGPLSSDCKKIVVEIENKKPNVCENLKHFIDTRIKFKNFDQDFQICIIQTCEDKNCQNCVENKMKKCSKCRKNYSLEKNNICLLKKKKFVNCLNQKNEQCIACKDFFFLDQNNFCKKCSAHCLKCESPYKCLKCDSGFILSNKFQCVLLKHKYSNFHSKFLFKINYDIHLRQFTFNSLNNFYPNCKLTLKMKNISICFKCEESFSKNIFGNCIFCGNNSKSCLFHPTTNQIKSLKCKNSFFFNRKIYTCSKCPQNCILCKRGKCLKCSKNAKFDKFLNKCISCNVPNCLSCSQNEICQKCKNNFFLGENNKCKQCVKNCKFCLNSKRCLSCVKNHILTADTSKCYRNCQNLKHFFLDKYSYTCKKCSECSICQIPKNINNFKECSHCQVCKKKCSFQITKIRSDLINIYSKDIIFVQGMKYKVLSHLNKKIKFKFKTDLLEVKFDKNHSIKLEIDKSSLYLKQCSLIEDILIDFPKQNSFLEKIKTQIKNAKNIFWAGNKIKEVAFIILSFQANTTILASLVLIINYQYLFNYTFIFGSNVSGVTHFNQIILSTKEFSKNFCYPYSVKEYIYNMEMSRETFLNDKSLISLELFIILFYIFILFIYKKFYRTKTERKIFEFFPMFIKKRMDKSFMKNFFKRMKSQITAEKYNNIKLFLQKQKKKMSLSKITKYLKKLNKKIYKNKYKAGFIIFQQYSLFLAHGSAKTLNLIIFIGNNFMIYVLCLIYHFLIIYFVYLYLKRKVKIQSKIEKYISKQKKLYLLEEYILIKYEKNQTIYGIFFVYFLILSNSFLSFGIIFFILFVSLFIVIEYDKPNHIGFEKYFYFKNICFIILFFNFVLNQMSFEQDISYVSDMIFALITFFRLVITIYEICSSMKKKKIERLKKEFKLKGTI